MTNLIEQIRAAIDEEERIAREATPGPWHWRDEPNPGWGHQPPDLMSGGELVISSWGHDADGVSVEEQDMAHIARHDPASVLRKVEGARKVLDWHVDCRKTGETVEWTCDCNFNADYEEWTWATAENLECKLLPMIAPMFGVEGVTSDS